MAQKFLEKKKSKRVFYMKRLLTICGISFVRDIGKAMPLAYTKFKRNSQIWSKEKMNH